MLVNSEARAARVRHLLHPALADLVREPLVERVTPEQAMAEAGTAGASAARAIPEGVDPAELRAAVHEVLDRQYRKTLGEPVPMLGGKSPTAGGAERGRAAGGGELAQGPGADERPMPARRPVRDYDFGWMWEELGVSDLRT